MNTPARWTSIGPLAPTLDALLRHRSFVLLLAVRLALAGIGLVLAARGNCPPLLLVGLLAAALAVQIRSPNGLDGSAQMSVLVLAAASLASLSARCADAALWFLALQLCLSYLVAGGYKLVSPAWKDGSALIGISRTAIYGSASMHRFLSARPSWAAVLGLATILFECTFPFAVWMGPVPRAAFLAAGIGFHAAIAITMGLNGFFLAFLSAYPALMYITARP